jgi:transcriptional regulator with XRE-family HTH domain
VAQTQPNTSVFVRLVGKRVRHAREASGISQSQLERDAGLIPTTISRLERGAEDVDVYDLYRVSVVLAVDIRTLLPTDEEVELGTASSVEE